MRNKDLYLGLLSIALLIILIPSCTRQRISPKSTEKANIEGYILTSEKIMNGYFNNSLFYFFPSNNIDTLKPSKQFFQSVNSIGYGFSLYSSYNIRLINSMGMDIISYSIDTAKSDPYRFKIEYWKVLPVKINLEFDSNIKNKIKIIEDSLLMGNGRYLKFKYNYVGPASIKIIDILLQKSDDLSGNEAMLPLRKYGIFGTVKRSNEN